MHSWSGASDVIVRCGSHDPELEGYHYLASFPEIKHYVGDDDPYKDSITGNAGYLPAQQEMYERYPGYSGYLSIEDDCTFEEKFFDRRILDLFDRFPNRCGMVRLHDLAQQIESYAFSDVWCNALGCLWPAKAGEPGFKIMPVIAGNLITQGPRFRHRPLLRSQGYTGDERRGALETPGIVEKFHGEGERMELWLSHNVHLLRQRLQRAAYS